MALTPTEEAFLSRLSEIIENNLSNESFDVSELTRQMGMSRTSLHRKLKAATGTSISSFIRKVRLERAMELLKQSSSTISEIAFEVGFHSVTYFIKSFHDYYGYAPGEVRKGEQDNAISEESHSLHKRTGFMRKRVSLTLLVSIITVFITALVLILVFKPFKGKYHLHEKSIAVLPFLNNSPEDNNQHFIDGIMEDIFDNLSKIQDIKVVSRTSVEQYRKNPKPVKVISKELGVSYVLEGSGQKVDDAIKLTIQLIDAVHDRHIWSRTYEREYRDVFKLQSEIAQSVAREINATITAVEKQRIEKVPTTNLTAYDIVKKAWMERSRYNYRLKNKEALEKAEMLFRYALEYDSTIAGAYIGLSRIYLDKYFLNADKINFLDSMLALSDVALSYDEQSSGAYWFKGYYYRVKGMVDEAIDEFEKAIEYNPNSSNAYFEISMCYWPWDLLNTIKYMYKAAELRNEDLPRIYTNLSWSLDMAGHPEPAHYFNSEALKLNNDSSLYYNVLGWSAYYHGDFNRALDLGIKAINCDSSNTNTLYLLGSSSLYLNQPKSSLFYYEKLINLIDRESSYLHSIAYQSEIGYVYLLNDRTEEAENHMNRLIANMESFINQDQVGRNYWTTYFFLASLYAVRGDKEGAMKNLRIYNQQNWESLPAISNIKNNPMFDNLRGDPEFQQIVRDVEAKYQAEHERVRQWLEENDYL